MTVTMESPRFSYENGEVLTFYYIWEPFMAEGRAGLVKVGLSILRGLSPAVVRHVQEAQDPLMELFEVTPPHCYPNPTAP